MPKIDFSAAISAEDRLAAEAARAAAGARKQRDRLIAASDWTQVADAPVDREAWATYRQALRDITDQDGFPHQIDWPEPPA